MTPFSLSARYYDLLYRDKDYRAEAAYLGSMIREFHGDAATILDLGCGTGIHAALLREAGYELVGVDVSEAMLERARSENPELTFILGDVRTVRLEQKFDVVTSLFHVASYQTSNRDVNDFCATLRDHLAPEGIAIFDCWYGPGVLTDRPVVRVKRFDDDHIRVLRIAEPDIDSEKNTVDVRYEIRVEDKSDSSFTTFREGHLMRYFFLPEIELFLEQNGLKLIAAHEWLTKRKPDFDCWNLTVIAARA